MQNIRPRKHHSTAAVLLIITGIAAAVLALCVLFLWLSGIRYIRVDHAGGYVKYFGRVDDAGDPVSGTLVYENGVRARVDREKSEIVYSNGDLYDGTLKNLLRDGTGRLIYASGDVYVGEFSQDALSGEGEYTYVNGDTYRGGFKNGVMDGEGVYTWADGSVYTGSFRDGKKDGAGVFVWANGDRYEGGYTQDKKSGEGVYTWANGDRY